MLSNIFLLCWSKIYTSSKKHEDIKQYLWLCPGPSQQALALLVAVQVPVGTVKWPLLGPLL